MFAKPICCRKGLVPGSNPKRILYSSIYYIRMMKAKLFARLSTLESVATTHQTGKKNVFLHSGDTRSAITQFAYGELEKGEGVASHVHPTMEECFFFLSGNGIFYIGEEKFVLDKDVFILVPANTPHWLSNDGNDKLTFVYFGVAIE